MNATIDIRSGRSGVTVVSAAGDVDRYTAPALRRALLDAIPQDGVPRVVVDMGSAEFVDADGVGVLMEAGQRARRMGGRLALAAMPDRLLKRLESVGLISVRLFALFATVEQAEQEWAEISTGGLPAVRNQALSQAEIELLGCGFCHNSGVEVRPVSDGFEVRRCPHSAGSVPGVISQARTADPADGQIVQPWRSTYPGAASPS